MQKYPIKFVARRTGLSPHAIRIWEKRYNAVSPERTTTNRRLYSDADIERLLLLHEATLAGHAIGQIAKLPTETLRKLLSVEETADLRNKVTAEMKMDTISADAILAACLEQVKQLNPEGLQHLLEDAEIRLSKPMLIEQLIVPLMHKIGDLWRDGTLRVIHEHMTTAVVRSFLGSMHHAYDISTTAPCIVITTPIGQLHELGALMAATTSSSEGWRVIYLGPNLPAEEIAAAVVQNNARAVGLSIVYPGDDIRISEEMRKLRHGISNEVAILVGGRAAGSYQDVLEAVGAVRLKDMVSLAAALENLQLR
ncbi:MAG: MerR family transcriptional regulator [candidate division KSB1 bacterium]|nr:MerR family transcriptional regulator [candidate division KSB1 bacterium]MDZ7302504.1 MerR family transcriptional regulator [candidate division KSB1 bacterium]MDZ7311900.1 MerR family transcriptional regulator [candidate division KSB1 bacterium]